MNAVTLEHHLFDIAKAFVSEVLPIKGNVYYRGLRPIQKKAEDYGNDLVVAFLAGKEGDVQKGTCLVNVYVSDIGAASGMFYKDIDRCAEIATALESFPSFANHFSTRVLFKKSDMIVTEEDKEIKQHFVSLKMEFKVPNENV